MRSVSKIILLLLCIAFCQSANTGKNDPVKDSNEEEALPKPETAGKNERLKDPDLPIITKEPKNEKAEAETKQNSQMNEQIKEERNLVIKQAANTTNTTNTTNSTNTVTPTPTNPPEQNKSNDKPDQKENKPEPPKFEQAKPALTVAASPIQASPNCQNQQFRSNVFEQSPFPIIPVQRLIPTPIPANSPVSPGPFGNAYPLQYNRANPYNQYPVPLRDQRYDFPDDHKAVHEANSAIEDIDKALNNIDRLKHEKERDLKRLEKKEKKIEKKLKKIDKSSHSHSENSVDLNDELFPKQGFSAGESKGKDASGKEAKAGNLKGSSDLQKEGKSKMKTKEGNKESKKRAIQ